MVHPTPFRCCADLTALVSANTTSAVPEGVTATEGVETQIAPPDNDVRPPQPPVTGLRIVRMRL